MSSLTQSALLFKKAFFWGVFTICVVIALMIFTGIGKSIKNSFFPPPPLPATVAFGTLPPVDVSDGFGTPGGIVFELETISGGLPALPSMASVFVVNPGESSFGDVGNVRYRAEQVGFRGEPSQLSPSEFMFTDQNDPDRTLIINSLTQNFTLESNFISNADILSTNPGSEDGAISTATRFFENYGLDLSDYSAEKVQVRRLRIDGTSFVEVPTISSANIIEVNFLRNDFGDTPVYWIRKNESGVSAVVSNGRVLSARAISAPVKKNRFSTYPIRPVNLAFEDLQRGAGVFNEPITSGKISILDVSLGYLESAKTQGFLQPVYVFKSVEGLVGFVSAIDGLWINSSVN